MPQPSQPWAVVGVGDLEVYLVSAAVSAADALVPAGVNRSDRVVADVVARVRGAVLNGGRFPLSLTPGSVPPEAVQYVMVLSVEAMATASPQLMEYVGSEQLGWSIKAARDWLKGVADGSVNVTYPADPDPDTIPAGTKWGDAQGTSDLGTAGKVNMSVFS